MMGTAMLAIGSIVVGTVIGSGWLFWASYRAWMGR